MKVELKYQTIVQRICAGFIDRLVLTPILMLLEAICTNKDFQYDLYELIVWSIYCIFLIGKTGQTIGKKVLGIKVVCVDDETKTIGFLKAFYRDSISIILSFLVIFFNNSSFAKFSSFYLIWLLIEILSALINNKRRAIHDFLAGSVIIETDAYKKEIENKNTGIT